MTDIVKTALNALAGEAVGHTVAIGAVYVLPPVLPGVDKALHNVFRKAIASWRGTPEEKQEEPARIAKDVAVMQTAGLSNFVTQLALLRQDRSAARSMGHDMGRLVSGRVGGTVASLAAEYAMREFMPGVTRAVENCTANAVHSTRCAFHCTPKPSPLSLTAPKRYDWTTKGECPDEADKHLASVIVSNLVQTLGAIPGNTALQHVFDALVESRAFARL